MLRTAIICTYDEADKTQLQSPLSYNVFKQCLIQLSTPRLGDKQK